MENFGFETRFYDLRAFPSFRNTVYFYIGYNLGGSVERMLNGLIFERRKIDVVIVQSMTPTSEELKLSIQQFFSFCLERGVYLKWSLYLFNV